MSKESGGMRSMCVMQPNLQQYVPTLHAYLNFVASVTVFCNLGNQKNPSLFWFIVLV